MSVEAPPPVTNRKQAKPQKITQQVKSPSPLLPRAKLSHQSHTHERGGGNYLDVEAASDWLSLLQDQQDNDDVIDDEQQQQQQHRNQQQQQQQPGISDVMPLAMPMLTPPGGRTAGLSMVFCSRLENSNAAKRSHFQQRQQHDALDRGPW